MKLKHIFVLMLLASVMINYADIVLAQTPIKVIVTQGEVKTGFWLVLKNTGEIDFHVAKASGSASDWVNPKIIDFGIVKVGQSKRIDNAFTLSIPETAPVGSYTLEWHFYVVDTGQKLDVAMYSIEVVEKISLIRAYLLILVIVAAIAVVAVLLVKRRRRATFEAQHPSSAQVAGTKFCINCGSQIPSVAVHCPNCGAKQ